MYRKLLSILVMLAALAVVASATAPTWVAAGQHVSYTVTTDTGSTITLVYVIDTIANNEIDMSLDQTQNGNVVQSRPIDYTNVSSGEFWFDPARFRGSLFNGQLISGYTVDETSGQHTVAGRQWQTVTLSKTVQGVLVRSTYDKETGLMLIKEATQDTSLLYHEEFDSASPPVGETNTTASSPPPSSSPAPGPSPNPSPSPSPGSSPPPATSPSPSPAPVHIPDIQPPPPEAPTSGLPCLPSFALLALAGSGILLSRKN